MEPDNVKGLGTSFKGITLYVTNPRDWKFYAFPSKF
jgi:hypothetical protein